MALRPLLGSERTPLSGARDAGAADPNDAVEVSVLVRRRRAGDLSARMSRLRRGDKSEGHMSRDRFAANYGADPADMAAVAGFANAHGLSVISQDPPRRTLVLSGPSPSRSSLIRVSRPQERVSSSRLKSLSLETSSRSVAQYREWRPSSRAWKLSLSSRIRDGETG